MLLPLRCAVWQRSQSQQMRTLPMYHTTSLSTSPPYKCVPRTLFCNGFAEWVHILHVFPRTSRIISVYESGHFVCHFNMDKWESKRLITYMTESSITCFMFSNLTMGSGIICCLNTTRLTGQRCEDRLLHHDMNGNNTLFLATLVFVSEQCYL